MDTEILYLVADLGTGGQERQLFYLNKNLGEVGRKTSVAVWDFNPLDKYYILLKELQIEVLDLNHYNSILQKIFFLRDYIRSRNVKIFHSFSFHLNFAVFLSCIGSSCKPLGGIRSRFSLYQKDSSMLSFYLNCFTPKHQLSNNSLFNEKFRWRKLHEALNKVFIVGNALDINRFVPIPSTERSYIKTISIGRFTHEKRIDLLIKMVAILKAKDIKLIHYHAGSGPLENKMKKQLCEMKCEDFFILSGNVEDIPTFLADADIFIHAADFEGYPNVVMEAMASGKAVVTTNCGDVSLMIDEGINGFIVPVNDVESLAERVIHLYNHPELRKKMGMYGRQKAESLFSINALRKKTLKVYHQINTKICVE